jgi:hypothetical protein
LTCTRGEPLTCYRGWREKAGAPEAALLLVEFELAPYWLKEAEPIRLKQAPLRA